MMDPEFSFPILKFSGLFEKHVPTRNTRTDCCNPAVAADLGGSLWATWQKGFGIPVPFRIFNVPFVKQVPIVYGKSLPGSW